MFACIPFPSEYEKKLSDTRRVLRWIECRMRSYWLDFDTYYYNYRPTERTIRERAQV